MRLTDEELAAMPAKARKEDEEVLRLYREHDFLEAYARHTDRRIALTGYKAAIGGGDSWEAHGDLKRDFLISQGMRPGHSLLEIGCGTGRLARKVVPYLGDSKYIGVDISGGARDKARELSQVEGWWKDWPVFLNRIPMGRQFHYIWAFSVMNHNPLEVVESLMRDVASAMGPCSKFFFSYIPEDRELRAGVKTFRKTLAQYKAAAEQAGLTFEDCGNWIRTAGHVPSFGIESHRIALATRV